MQKENFGQYNKKSVGAVKGPDFKLTCDDRTFCCHGNVANEKDDAYW
jgi:hypothetical protein